MSLVEEMQEIDDEPRSQAAIVKCADLAKRALAVNDLGVVVQARQLEAQHARGLGMQQHTLVVCAELIELWPRLREYSLDEHQIRRLVWTFKHGAGAAMDLPEIPLSTVRELLGQLAEILTHYGLKQIPLWELEARLAWIENDAKTVRARIRKISPTISLSSHLWDNADCPGCMLMEIVTYLGPNASLEEVEAVTEPLRSGEPFPADKERASVLRLFYGDDPMCEHAKMRLPAEYAKAYARGGKRPQARLHAKKALAAAGAAANEFKVRAHCAALEVALGGRTPAKIDEHVAFIAASLGSIESPYEVLDAVKLLHHAAIVRKRPDEAERYRVQALELARRIDKRLATPRHERETTETFAARAR